MSFIGNLFWILTLKSYKYRGNSHRIKVHTDFHCDTDASADVVKINELWTLVGFLHREFSRVETEMMSFHIELLSFNKFSCLFETTLMLNWQTWKWYFVWLTEDSGGATNTRKSQHQIHFQSLIQDPYDKDVALSFKVHNPVLYVLYILTAVEELGSLLLDKLWINVSSTINELFWW